MIHSGVEVNNSPHCTVPAFRDPTITRRRAMYKPARACCSLAIWRDGATYGFIRHSRHVVCYTIIEQSARLKIQQPHRFTISFCPAFGWLTAGAMLVDDSEIYMHGNTSFINNWAHYDGGKGVRHQGRIRTGVCES